MPDPRSDAREPEPYGYERLVIYFREEALREQRERGERFRVTIPHFDGEMVRAEIYDALAARLAEAHNELRRLHAIRDKYGEPVDLAAHLAEVEQELARLRADADLGVREIRCQVARAERAQADLERAREALEFYAGRDTWSMSGVAWLSAWTKTDSGTTGDRKTDRGATARAALAASSPTTTTEANDDGR